MSITIKDIAKKAGITPSSVSKALNDRSDISDEMKNRVKSIAEEMGYKKNILASRLVMQKSNTIGVFIFSRSKIRNSQSTAFHYLNLMLSEAKKMGYDIVLFSIESLFSKEKSYIDLCIERQVEGAIFIGFENDDPHIEEMKSSDIPVVMIEKDITGERISCITTDNKKAINIGLNYLFDLGHKDIAFIKGHFAAEVTEIRYAEFKEVMKKKGCFRSDFIFEGDFSLDSGYNIGVEISQLKEAPTAVFSSNDLMAIGMQRAFIDKNISVPEDVSILGFDNFEIGKFLTPRLTTISQNFEEIGAIAINELVDMIRSNIKSKKIFIEPELIVRESCRRLISK